MCHYSIIPDDRRKAMKICKKCQKSKNIEDFPKNKDSKDGRNSLCKLCINKRNKEYREKNSESFKLARKKYYQKNINKLRNEKRKYHMLNKDKKAEYDKIYRSLNKENIKNHKKKWELKNKNNPIFKIKRNLRRRIHHVLIDGYKSASTFELIGCTPSEFKIYIESKFQDGMSWDNYGTNGWHIDHIIPCSSFDLTDPKQQKICFHYSNQQPLWAKDNLKKGKTIQK